MYGVKSLYNYIFLNMNMIESSIQLKLELSESCYCVLCKFEYDVGYDYTNYTCEKMRRNEINDDKNRDIRN